MQKGCNASRVLTCSQPFTWDFLNINLDSYLMALSWSSYLVFTQFRKNNLKLGHELSHIYMQMQLNSDCSVPCPFKTMKLKYSGIGDTMPA